MRKHRTALVPHSLRNSHCRQQQDSKVYEAGISERSSNTNFTSESDKSDQQSSAAEKPEFQSFNQFRVDITAIFSLSERAAFIDKATHVLFITEYLVLMEYTEVMIPVIYCKTTMTFSNVGWGTGKTNSYLLCSRFA